MIHSVSNPYSCSFLSHKEKLIRIQNRCTTTEVPGRSASIDPLFKKSVVGKAHRHRSVHLLSPVAGDAQFLQIMPEQPEAPVGPAPGATEPFCSGACCKDVNSLRGILLLHCCDIALILMQIPHLRQEWSFKLHADINCTFLSSLSNKGISNLSTMPTG